MPFLFPVLLFFLSGTVVSQQLLVPLNIEDRSSWETIVLTEIGAFGLWRKARPEVAAHHHTGLDLVAGEDRRVFPSAPGKVISVRDDGPFAQIIIEHHFGGCDFWTVYEHLGTIRVHVGQQVLPDTPLGCLMNGDELKRWGSKFNHLHFEVMIKAPPRLEVTAGLPERHYASWGLSCNTKALLDSRYINPEESNEILPCNN